MYQRLATHMSSNPYMRARAKLAYDRGQAAGQWVQRLLRRRYGHELYRMIRLTFHGASAEPSTSLVVTDFRVTGGALWNPLEAGLLANYSSGWWKHRACHYRRISVTGGVCLLFGITRDPTLMSDPVRLLHFSGRTLRANGKVIAEYIEQQDMWHGVVRPIWWSAMRIISRHAMAGLVDTARIVHLNPWEPVPANDGIALPPASAPGAGPISPVRTAKDRNRSALRSRTGAR